MISFTSEKLRDWIESYEAPVKNYHDYIFSMKISDGAKCLADNGDAHWFLRFLSTDPICRSQADHFAIATLHVADIATVYLRDADGNLVLEKIFSNPIKTPIGTWEVYMVADRIMLPLESD